MRRIFILQFVLLLLLSAAANAQITATVSTNTSETHNAYCPQNGQITINPPSGGVAPYAFAIIAGPVTRPVQTSSVFSNLPSGTYTLRVYDAATPVSLQQDLTYTIVNDYTPLNFPISTATTTFCGQPNGTIRLFQGMTGHQGRAPYSYRIVSGPAGYPAAYNTFQAPNGANESTKFDNLPAGTYQLQLQDGCGEQRSVTINVIAGVTPVHTITETETYQLNCATGVYDQWTIYGTVASNPSDLSVYNTSGTMTLTSPSGTVYGPVQRAGNGGFPGMQTPVASGNWTLNYTDTCGNITSKIINIVPKVITPPLTGGFVRTGCNGGNVTFTGGTNWLLTDADIEYVITAGHPDSIGHVYNGSNNLSTAYCWQFQARSKKCPGLIFGSTNSSCAPVVPTLQINAVALPTSTCTPQSVPVTVTIQGGQPDYKLVVIPGTNGHATDTATVSYGGSTSQGIINVTNGTTVTIKVLDACGNIASQSITVNAPVPAQGVAPVITGIIADRTCGSSSVNISVSLATQGGSPMPINPNQFTVSIYQILTPAQVASGEYFTVSIPSVGLNTAIYYSLGSLNYFANGTQSAMTLIKAVNTNDTDLVKLLIIARNPNGCTTTYSIDSANTIVRRLPTADNSVSITCNDNSVSVIANGANGIAPYRYEIRASSAAVPNPNPWSTIQTSNLFSGITQGSLFDIRVTDACNNARITTNATAPFNPSLELATDPVSCAFQPVILKTTNLPANATGVTYTFRKVGNPTPLQGPGTLSTYTIPSAQLTDNGTYEVDVTVNGCKTFTKSVTVSVISCVVPVTLTSFTAQKQGRNALLVWETATENNSRRFIVQHSKDNSTWDVIGYINAAGQSATLRTYSFTDLPGSGTQFYRLIQEDIDGHQKLSDVRSLYFDNDNTTALQAYPNPVSNTTNVIVSGAGKYSLRLYDATGKVVRIVINVTAGSTTKLDLSSISKGIYFLEATAENAAKASVERIKLIKQ